MSILFVWVVGLGLGLWRGMKLNVDAYNLS